MPSSSGVRLSAWRPGGGAFRSKIRKEARLFHDKLLVKIHQASLLEASMLQTRQVAQTTKERVSDRAWDGG